MKRLTLTLALILTSLMSFSQTKDSDGHTLVSLWKTYYKAEKADKPQDQAQALEAIKQEAAARHLAWDWYDAATRYVDVKSSVNWKDRSKLQSALEAEIDSLGEPVAVFYHRHYQWGSKAAEYVDKHKETLLASHNPEFYTHDHSVSGKVFSPVIVPGLKNDYEYVLWSMYLRKEKCPLRQYYGDAYPQAAIAEYFAIDYWSTAKEYEEWGAFAEKYKTKAVSLLARQNRLNYEFNSLNNQKNPTSEDYRALRAKCVKFEQDRKAFSASEKVMADCCTAVTNLIENLDSKSISAEVKNDKMTLSLRNVQSLSYKVVKEKDNSAVLHKSDVTNKKGSYYIQDTVIVQLPGLDDGDYQIYFKSGDCENMLYYGKHTLSISVRAKNDGYGAYVADYMTGKPIETCDLYIYDSDSKEIESVKGVAMDGFTPLPKEFEKYFTTKYREYYLRAGFVDDGRQRWSQLISMRSPNPGEVRKFSNTPVSRGLLITDRGAYNPDETVRFKAVLYTGTYEYTLCPAGTEVTAILLDTKGEKAAQMALITNGFGSVAGEFTLSGVTRGGMYTVCVESNGKRLADRQIRVDEFVLPTFELIWDTDDQLYIKGDKVKVSGKVKAYSGHSLADAKLFYTVDGADPIIKDRPLAVKSDGSFSFEFKSVEDYSRHYGINVKIVDGTGETLEWNTWRQVYGGLPLGIDLLNNVRGSYTASGAGDERGYSRNWIVREDCARFHFYTDGRTRDGMEIRYFIKKGKEVLRSGACKPQETVDVNISDLRSGMYTVEAEVTANDFKGKQLSYKTSVSFVKAADTDTALDMNVSSFFKELGGEDIAIQFGATNGPVWAVVELMGSGNVLLEHQIVALSGKRGANGSLATVSYTRKPEYSENLSLHVMWFRDGSVHEYTRTLRLPIITRKLPLSFTRFTDSARPGEECRFVISTDPGVECAVAVFDKATETIKSNWWSGITPLRKPESSVHYSNVCGYNGTVYRYRRYEDGLGGGRVMMSKASLGAVPEESMAVEESAMNMELSDSAADAEAAPEVHVRDNFSATMAWEPFLESGADGVIDFKCKGSDRLSTYYVQLFAHTEGMRNAVLRQEMQVTIPVKVSLVEPQFLYQGDKYTARASISNNLKEAVSGRAAVRFFDGADYKTAKVLGTKQLHYSLEAGEAKPFAVEFEVPEGVSELGVLVQFAADNGDYASDAAFVSVPVHVPLQTVTEAHSAVLLAGADRAALIAGLRAAFVNIDGSSLEPVERDIQGMIKDAIPDKVTPESSNVMSLTEAYYANVIARRLGAPGLSDQELEEILGKIAACQNSSGGISWFEGMESSPIITAAVLQRIAAMPERDLGAINTIAAVKYLDSNYFEQSDRPWWYGGLSLAVYLQTRALYASVPFDAPSGKAYREFKKEVKAYLVPKQERGMNGQILAKARRLRTLQSLSQGGSQLAKSWGIRLSRKILRSLDADVESLLQYAVEHRSGGCYYPNAVMPWRGLLESEVYAHSLLCDLFTDASTTHPAASWSAAALKTAEGIRLWLMIQKETQQWDTDPAYIESIASVLRGTPETLATKVILLSGTFTKPFPQIKASGNGFTVSRSFSVDGRIIGDGDILKVGDRVRAEYKIWNEENRSFVRLNAPRPASLRPVNQLSGRYGWWLRPLSVGGWIFSPQGYRSVKADITEYWFDSYPEENTTIVEEFFVTQEGAFQTPAVTIESLYAPHYRANDDGRGALVSGK